MTKNKILYIKLLFFKIKKIILTFLDHKNHYVMHKIEIRTYPIHKRKAYSDCM